MASAIRRAVLGCAFTASAACGLVFAPGDYSEPAVLSPEGGTPVQVDEAGLPIQNDTGPPDAPRTGKRVLLFAGRRPALPSEASPAFVAETIRVPVSDTGGVIGPIAFDSAPPVANGYTRALRLDPNPLLLQRDTTTYRAELAERLTTDWSILALRGGNVENGQRGWITDAGLLSAGGFAVSNGAATPNVYRAPLNFGDGGIDGWGILQAKLVRARGDVTLYRHNNLLYAIGGRDNLGTSAPGKEHVEVAQIGADGLPGAFEATEVLVNPTTMASHGVYLPPVTAGKGFLFVVGGQTTANASAVTDVVLAAKMNETTGKLDKWIAAPKLPSPLANSAVIVIGDQLLVFGGAINTTDLSDGILALAINPDGSLGTEWRRVGSLPGPRSQLVAVEY